MEIKVCTLTGKEIPLEINDSFTIHDLKVWLEKLEGVPYDEQRYICSGMHMHDGVPIVEQIEKCFRDREQTRSSSTVRVNLVKRLRGGGNRVFHRPVISESFADPEDDDDDDYDHLKPDDSQDGNEEQTSKPSGGRLQIHIKTRKGKEIPVEITPTDTVDEVKQKVLDKEGISPFMQKLTFGGVTLDHGVVYDWVNSILAHQPQLVDNFDTGETIQVTLVLVLKGIREDAIFFPRDHQKQVGSSKYDLDDGNKREKGSTHDETKGRNIGKMKLAVEGEESRVLFEIPHSATEKIHSKPFEALHSEGIDQIIEGMYSLQLFRSRAVPETERKTQFVVEESNDTIIELREKISKMEAELATLKAFVKDVERR